MSRRGVCRDFAHVTIALLRAMEIPARMVAVYAPGLSPMDFHAGHRGRTSTALVGHRLVAPRSAAEPHPNRNGTRRRRHRLADQQLDRPRRDVDARGLSQQKSLPFDTHADRVQLG